MDGVLWKLPTMLQLVICRVLELNYLPIFSDHVFRYDMIFDQVIYIFNF